MNIQEIVTKSTLKQRIAAALVAGTIGGGYWYNTHASVSPQQAVTSGMHKENSVKFTVLSGKDFLDGKTKQPKSTVVNDTADHKAASFTVYIDRTRCPQWNYASLQGKTITVKGFVQEYKGKDGKSKPEIKVTSPDQISVAN
jgi:DNA/RNA endonuclease YhcR with UshA esterase domain